ncbi:unnamed protein product [Acanthoscelides obtectus]|uniref:Uncharacterized protein n=1 Tax=Acanthoscelides obtectus TaxID=200917 RepID=A0A9P0Q6M7_ACAOB|nr:unnamed protein product [Acanthoscelides obtectus]CAK1666836.1 hypothetical protein AOBTE_LOCUS25512 [Acanthoscelides obtectus]
MPEYASHFYQPERVESGITTRKIVRSSGSAASSTTLSKVQQIPLFSKLQETIAKIKYLKLDNVIKGIKVDQILRIHDLSNRGWMFLYLHQHQVSGNDVIKDAAAGLQTKGKTIREHFAVCRTFLVARFSFRDQAMQPETRLPHPSNPIVMKRTREREERAKAEFYRTNHPNGGYTAMSDFPFTLSPLAVDPLICGL